MTTIGKQIQNADEAISRNIELLAQQRPLLSQNLLSQLRNLVEGVSVFLNLGSVDAEFIYHEVGPGLDFVRSQAKFNFLGKFHKLLQASSSHYALDGDTSERLMLKYYEYLLRLRGLLENGYGISVLQNLEKFPLDLDPSLAEYHEKIAQRIDHDRPEEATLYTPARYYIHKILPFFVDGRIYYEVTFYLAINKVNKFNRMIAFTDIDMTDKYSAMLTLQKESIDVFGVEMPVTIIRKWEVSIRPCELDNFARFIGDDIKTNTRWPEYRFLMSWLTDNSANLLDLIDMPDNEFESIREEGIPGMTTPRLFPLLENVRGIVRPKKPGCNVLRYLVLRMRNQIIKRQYYNEGCKYLSHLKLSYGCIPFDDMPFCTSLPGHNPRYWDLVESLDATGKDHELLARRVKNNVEQHGILYTPVDELKGFGDVEKLINTYNQKLYRKHTDRVLEVDKGHVFIRGYEDDTVSIILRLKVRASSGIAGYTQAVDHWLKESPRNIDDPAKENALKRLFTNSSVACIYGSAGTGKSTMVNHIANYFNENNKLFLAQTNPAIDNLKRKVNAQNSTFRTISSQIHRTAREMEYDLLIIDECSTVSNADLIKMLDEINFKLLVLVGDIYQIESIRFGNWFGIIPSFIPSESVFELMTPYRTKNESLVNFWNKVRNIEDDIAEVIARSGYSSDLSEKLFEIQGDDEIILCLNYDGLYGINNVNRFLQSGNTGKSVTWRETTYKVGDPVLFHESERFRPVIYNNLKGRIVRIIKSGQDWIRFDIELDRPVSEFDVDGRELEWVEGSTVRFKVYGRDASDNDDDSLSIAVPFQVAYAVSIHKSQGLEYDSVKIVITDANEEDITHNIFYTAITRAREHLKIFWTPETQQKVLQRLSHNANSKDIALLKSRCGLVSVNY